MRCPDTVRGVVAVLRSGELRQLEWWGDCRSVTIFK